jgi:hypothetical protein
MLFFVNGGKLDVNDHQYGEDHRLKKPDEDFQKVKGNRNDHSENGGEPLGSVE